MSYLHIKNLYAIPTFLEAAGPEVYALEKIHGTSARLNWKYDPVAGNASLAFHAGGESYDNFCKLFDIQKLLKVFNDLAAENDFDSVIVHGEAYGGKQQGMKATYGPSLKFVVFDIMVGNTWLSVDKAASFTKELGLEFVHYEKGPNTLEWLNAQRDTDSVQAIRNGMGPGKIREGVVVRPLVEVWNAETGDRLITKHKRAEFRETATAREVEVDPAKIQVLNDAKAIADEWVVEERLNHVLQKLNVKGMEDTPKVLNAMLEDVKREAAGEIVWSPEAERAIKNKTKDLFKKRIMTI